MSLCGKSILVLEEEFLIALEITRVLEEAGVRVVEIVHTVRELVEKEGELQRFDAVILEARSFGESVVPVAARIADAGVPIVFGTAFDEYRGGVPGFPDAPVVLKPYASDDVIAAIVAAIARQGPASPGEPA